MNIGNMTMSEAHPHLKVIADTNKNNDRIQRV